MMTLGDAELSYRSLAMLIQNLGDLGVDVTPIKDYNYRELGRWFHLLYELDAVSDHAPMMAAYYYGMTKSPQDVAIIVDYLRVVGSSGVGEKWRWLAQAVYLAQHRMYDVDLALKLDPHHVPALYNRASALNSLGRLDECLKALDATLAVDPKFAPALQSRKNTLSKLGRG